jgi:PEP-CTERM motif
MRFTPLRFLAVLSVFALAMPLAAHADSVDFNIVDGTFASGGTFSGSFTLDTSNDLITAFSITINTDGFTNLTVTEDNNFGVTWFGHANFQGGAAALLLAISPSTTSPQLCGISPLPGCTAGGQDTFIAYNAGTASDEANGGKIVAATPEPSSIAMLGTGILGAASIIRRRILTR